MSGLGVGLRRLGGKGLGAARGEGYRVSSVPFQNRSVVWWQMLLEACCLQIQALAARQLIAQAEAAVRQERAGTLATAEAATAATAAAMVASAVAASSALAARSLAAVAVATAAQRRLATRAVREGR